MALATTTLKKPKALRLPKSVDSETRKWVKTENDRRAVIEGCRFDLTAAQRVAYFFRRFLKHSKGEYAGKPFELLDWQWEHLIAPTFGWKKPDGDGWKRRIRFLKVYIPKKNGKSTLCAGIGTYLFMGDNEAGSEVYTTATKQAQARIVHGEAENMIKTSPQLLREVRINRTTKIISYENQHATYTCLSRDGPGIEGINPHGLIFDEIHAWKDQQFWDALRYATAARSQPLSVVISTAGEFNKDGIGYRDYTFAKKVRDGEIEDDAVQVFIAEAEAEDDITDPKVHKKANPSYGSTIKPDEMAREARIANENPHERLGFQRYRLNIWTQSLTSFFDIVDWDACCDEMDPADLAEMLKGRRCFGGLDLASREDIAAWVLLFPPTEEDDKWRMLERYFIPGDNALDRERKDSVTYVAWGNRGWLNLTQGRSIDFEAIRQQVIDDGRDYYIVNIGADRWNLEHIRQRLGDVGAEMYEFGQGFGSMSEPTKEFHSLVKSHAIAHCGNLVTKWMIGNAVARIDAAENVKLDKERSKEKIDGIIAAIMALGRQMVTDGPSVFDEDDVDDWLVW